MPDEETQQVEDLDAQIAALKAQKRERKAVEEQRKWLPALEKARALHQAKVAENSTRTRQIIAAIDSIENGKLTDFRLRARPVRRAKKEQAE